MKKIWLIGWKDVLLAFRDFAALIFMLLAPFLLTLGMGLITGRLSGSSSGPSGIEVIIVNQDNGVLGRTLEEIFVSEELSSLFAITFSDSPESARKTVDDDQSAAAVLVPETFTSSIIPSSGSISADENIPIEIYANPTRPTSVGIIQTIVDAFITQTNVKAVQSQVIVQQLVQSGLVPVSEVATLGLEIGLRQLQTDSTPSISIASTTGEGNSGSFDVLAYMAPGMAMMFLMYVVSRGGQTLLAERDTGTLARLRVSPTTTTQVLGGKVLGIFITGALQMFILIGASAALFELNWGNPLAVILLVLASVTGAVGWGLLITSFAKSPGQVAAVGSAIMLIFGVMGGSFFQVDFMPGWFQLIRKITPNAWSIDGFTILARGGGILDILDVILSLCIMGVGLFAIAVYLMNRSGFTES